jgi:hypothetical protein
MTTKARMFLDARDANLAIASEGKKCRIEKVLSASAIWSLVKVVNTALLQASKIEHFGWSDVRGRG